MKHNYILYILITGIILFRVSLLNLTNNFVNTLMLKDNTVEKRILTAENDKLKKEYNSLLDFQNNVKFDFEYSLTNIVKNNYGFNNLLINGDDYNIGDEVVNVDGLIGIVSKVYNGFSEVKLLADAKTIVNIGNEKGKITGSDEDNNLIIKEISNYNSISLNDEVYSIYGTYIGKVIKIKYEVIDNYLTVQPVNTKNINYVGVVKQS